MLGGGSESTRPPGGAVAWRGGGELADTQKKLEGRHLDFPSGFQA